MSKYLHYYLRISSILYSRTKEIPITSELLPLRHRYNKITKPLKEMFYMTMKKSKFTIRVEEDILKKFHYVAEYNTRSANREVEFLMRKRIIEFEKMHGRITIE